MKVRLDYGTTGLEIDLPTDILDVTVVEPSFESALPDELAAIETALARPIAGPALADLAHPGQRVTIVFSDITRPVPNRLLLPPILRTLASQGVRRQDVTLLNATGLHRPNTPSELTEMLGEAITGEYRVANHDAGFGHGDENGHSSQATTQSTAEVGNVLVGTTSRGTPVWLDRKYVEADLRILTGFVEPHFFAGFSGGAKSVMPGVAGAPTVMANHGYANLADPRATWGETAGNPVFVEAREAAELAPPDFILNVSLDGERRLTGVFAGQLAPAHDAACRFVGRAALREVPAPFDIVVTTNSGYPLDMNLYQAVKGMSAAAEVVAPGGTIIMAAECREGIGHGVFADLLLAASTPGGLLMYLAALTEPIADQWQVQLLARVLDRCPVYLYAEHLAAETIRAAHLIPTDDVAGTVLRLARERGSRTRVGILPRGPLTIPRLAASRILAG